MPGWPTDPGMAAQTALRERHPLADALAQGDGWIGPAQEPADLVRVCSLLRRQAQILYQEGLRSDVLTRIVAHWNDAVLRRLLQMYAEAFSGIRWCWLALGSEGREEQTLHTDQDNALLFESEDPAQTRDRLLPILREINEWLDRCGYVLCPGDVMASNPRWCLSAGEWRQVFASWIDTGDPQALLHGAIFFDFRGIAGDQDLASELRTWLLEHLKPRPVFLKMLAAQAVANAPPLWPWRDLRTRRHQGQPVIDLKVNGVALFVDAARVLSLAAGVPPTQTTTRLEQSARRPSEQRDRQAWVAAYRSLQDLRVRWQFTCMERGLEVGNRIPVSELSRFDRALLVQALTEAKKMQSSLRLRYLL